MSAPIGQEVRMVVALLVILGVDLVVVVAVAVLVVSRRRWLKRQTGEFSGAVRLTAGSLPGMGPKWKRGSGRWVKDTFVWHRAPLLFRTEVLPVDRVVGERQARPGEIKRLDDQVRVVELAVGEATFEVAAAGEDGRLLGGPVKEASPSNPGLIPNG